MLPHTTSIIPKVGTCLVNVDDGESPLLVFDQIFDPNGAQFLELIVGLLPLKLEASPCVRYTISPVPPT